MYFLLKFLITEMLTEGGGFQIKKDVDGCSEKLTLILIYGPRSDKRDLWQKIQIQILIIYERPSFSALYMNI